VGVAQGKFQITVNGDQHLMKLGDTMLIPKDTSYEYEVTSKEDVILLEGTK
jgi:gentisate 1,2-dioxygenase